MNDPDRAPIRRLPAALLLLALCAGTADTRAATPAFDYWVLALAWTPEVCAATRGKPDAPACEPQRGLAIDSLWPQTSAGPATDCAPESPLPATLAASLRPQIQYPDRAWNTHGRCSGLSAESYFERIALARARLNVPDKFLRGRANQRISKTQLEQAFLEANPGLSVEALTIECRSHYLTDVRLCLDPTLQPRACGADVGDICEREIIIRPQ